MQKFSMAVVIMAAMTFSTAVVYGDEIYKAVQDFYLAPSGEQVTKLEAVRLLVNDPKAQVVKCYPVELSDKVTIRKRRVKR